MVFFPPFGFVAMRRKKGVPVLFFFNGACEVQTLSPPPRLAERRLRCGR